ncbi:MAG: DUF2817 domain-containing protein [Calditrichia bacterium]
MKYVLTLLLLCAGYLSAKDYQLYFLGGQSNMEGFGYNKELPADLRKPFTDVMMFNGQILPDDQAAGTLGLWSPLQEGNGTGFSSDGRTNQYSDRFGPEMTFAQQLRQLQPNTPIALIKYARGGSSIALSASGYGTWDPDHKDEFGINQYDHFLKTLNQALAVRDIDGDGEDDRLIPAGILWMQGESDAHKNKDAANAYESNLRRIIDLFRAALRVDDLPVVIGEIADSGMDDDGRMMDYLKEVQQAQNNFVKKDPNATLIRTSDLTFDKDPWHYNSDGYIEMGKRFAKSAYRLNRRFTAGNNIYKSILDSEIPWRVIGQSTEKRDILLYEFGNGENTTLIFGGFHGNEQLGVEFVLQFAEHIYATQPTLKNTRVLIVPVLNPDGLIRNTRMNANNVDVNRNFPTENWTPKARSRQTNPGPEPASEIEARIAMSLLKNYKPDRIVSVHTPLEVVNFDGPAKKLAHKMAAKNGYLVKGDIGYPTPGSFGTYAGKENRIPSITLELPRSTIDKVWQANRDAVWEALKY